MHNDPVDLFANYRDDSIIRTGCCDGHMRLESEVPVEHALEMGKRKVSGGDTRWQRGSLYTQSTHQQRQYFHTLNSFVAGIFSVAPPQSRAKMTLQARLMPVEWHGGL